MQASSTATAKAAGRALANSTGQSFALLMSAIGLAQVVVAFTTAAQHQGGLIILLHDSQNPALSSSLDLNGDALMPFVIGAFSLLLGWIGNLIAVYYAGRNVARATGSAALGRRAGLIAIGLSMAAWVVLSVLGAALTGTNGLYMTVDPYSSTSLLQQTATVVIFTLIGALTLCALAIAPYVGSLAMGTSAGENQARASRMVP